MTPTGREAGRELYAGRVERCYLPYDLPGAVGRFLDHYRPHAGILMETEIWPNLIHACRRRSVPLYLVNARLSARIVGRLPAVRGVHPPQPRRHHGHRGADASRTRSGLPRSARRTWS